MLGIDIYDNKMNIVSLRHKSGRMVLQHSISVSFDPKHSMDVKVLGDLLKKTIEDNRLSRQPVIMTLPHRLCFVKRFSLDSLDVKVTYDRGSLSKKIGETLMKKIRNCFFQTSKVM